MDSGLIAREAMNVLRSMNKSRRMTLSCASALMFFLHNPSPPSLGGGWGEALKSAFRCRHR